MVALDPSQLASIELTGGTRDDVDAEAVGLGAPGKCGSAEGGTMHPSVNTTSEVVLYAESHTPDTDAICLQDIQIPCKRVNLTDKEKNVSLYAKGTPFEKC